jgi:hypothetical protein
MSPERSRLLALGILVLVIAALWLGVIVPVSDAFDSQAEDIARSHRLLEAYTRRIAMRPAIEAKLAETRTIQAVAATGLVSGASAELAAANVQGTVKTLIESGAGQITSVQNLAPANIDGFQRIDIQYDATLPMTRLRDVTYRIETAVPYLFLDAIDLRAPENWQQQGSATIDPPPLQVRWTVHAYRRAGTP